MSTLGQRLRSERESKGARRVDVAQATKVAVHHLAALEYGDFAALPDAVHTKGYVRVYAEYLGLDPAAVLAEFLEEYEAVRPGAAENPRDETVRKMSKMLAGSEKSPAARLGPWLVIAAIVAVLVLGWLGIRRIDFGGDVVAENAANESVEAVPSVAEERPRIADPAPVTPADAPLEQAVAAPVQKQAPSTAIEPQPAVEASPPPEVTPARDLSSGLSIGEHGVGTAVVNLRLQGESDRFAVGDRVSFWTRVLNGKTGQEIRHVWRHEGRQIASIPLRLGSANWRTYSRKTMYPGSVGSWTVEAVDEAGNVLASTEFACDP